MTFSRVWNTGISNGQPATGAQLTQLDLNVSRSLDGNAGGKSTPSALQVMSGKGVQVSDVNEYASFIIKDAKALGAALDLQTSQDPLNIGQAQDACGPKEGRVLIVSPFANDELYQSENGGITWQHNILSTSDFYNCIASTPPKDGGGDPNAIPGTVLIGCLSSTMYYALGTTNYTPYLTLSAGGSATEIDAIFYDTFNSQFIALGKTSSAPYLSSITASGIPAVTPQTVPAAITGSNVGLKVAQNPASGRMVASWASQTKLAYSDDGHTWTASSTTMTSASYSVAYGDGVFLAVDMSATSNIWKSSDGITWSTSGLTMPGNGTRAMNTAKAFACINGIFFVAYGSGVNYYSIDAGATWHLLIHMYVDGTPTKYDTSCAVKVIHNRLYLLQSHTSVANVSRSRKLGSALGGG